jgi:hypothetical protein
MKKMKKDSKQNGSKPSMNIVIAIRKDAIRRIFYVLNCAFI